MKRWILGMCVTATLLCGTEIPYKGLQYFDVGDEAMIRHGGVEVKVGEVITLTDPRGSGLVRKAEVTQFIGKKSIGVKILD